MYITEEDFVIDTYISVYTPITTLTRNKWLFAARRVRPCEAAGFADALDADTCRKLAELSDKTVRLGTLRFPRSTRTAQILHPSFELVEPVESPSEAIGSSVDRTRCRYRRPDWRPGRGW